MARKEKSSKTNYFEMFIKQAQCSCEAAEILAGHLNNFDIFDIPATVDSIHMIENAADDIRHDVVAALTKEFLPPIEREDILTLSNELDNVMDSVEEILRCIFMYNVSDIKPEAVRLFAVARESCEAVLGTVREFENYKKSTSLQSYIKKVNSLESEADTLYLEAMRSLFVNTCDPRELMSWTGIYAVIEQCCDLCEHVADAIEMAVMKNS